MAAQPQFRYSTLPEQAQEDALHAARLLSVEERAFQRVSKSLLGKESHLKWKPGQFPSPPPEHDGDDAREVDGESQKQMFAEDILLDFAALENSVIRIQLIQDSNRRERERYTAEKAKILEMAQAVRDNTIELRVQLAEAERVLELRKGFDNLAKKLIPDDEKLKPRVVCMEDIEKLEKEIEDLQHESASYEAIWLSRREAFDAVVAEGQAMVRLIKGIKDEPEPEAEKDKRMEDAEGEENETKVDSGQMAGTPMPDGEDTPRPVSGDDSASSHVEKFLDVHNEGTQSGSAAATPAARTEDEGGDVVMEDDEMDQETGPIADDAATPAQDNGEMDET